MGVYQCERCAACGSDLAEAPDLHCDPKPHRVLSSPVEAETDDGKQAVGTLSQCIWCHATLTEIKQRGQPWEPYVVGERYSR